MPRRSKGYPLDPAHSVIAVDVLLEGPDGRQLVRMALDTGATYTMAPLSTMQAIGYEPATAIRKIEFIAAGSVEYKPLVCVRAVSALGIRVPDLEVVCHDLPPQSPVRGLLGLNFLKHARLVVDYPRRSLRLSRGH